MKYTLPIVFLLCFFSRAAGFECVISEDSTIISVDQPIADGNTVIQQVNYHSSHSLQATIRIRCVMITAEDSLTLYDLSFRNKEIQAGLGSVRLDFAKNSKLFHIDYSFTEVIKRFKVLPPGRYVTYLDIISEPLPYATVVTNWYIDSMLSPFSTLRKDVNKTLENREVKVKSNTTVNKVKTTLTERQFDAINNKIDRKVAKKNQVRTRIEGNAEKRFSWFYYKKWCLGYYEIGPGMNERIRRENRLLKESPLDLINTDLEYFTSISSSSRNSSRSVSQNELTGSIDLISNMSTGRETGSVQDLNFQEVYGSFNTEIMKIPVVVDAYYTTQDNKRTAKASYIRLKYDRDRTKSDLAGKAKGFNNKFEDASSKGVGYKSVYLGVIDKLVAGQKKDAALFAKEYGVSDELLGKYNGDVDLMISELDTNALLDKSGEGSKSEQLVTKRQKLTEQRSDIERYYAKSKETNELITKYTVLLQQYEKQQYLDSALAYAKIKEVTDSPDMSTKQLGKAAEHILPPGKARSLLNSITKLELGVLNSYESDYTMSGQVLKGGTVGYDLGQVTLTASLGRTEYVSRDGSMDRYSSTMLRADLNPKQNRKLGFIYYTCSPTRQIITDNTFIGDSGGVPSFIKPVSIFALPFEILVSRDLSVSGEAATSYRNFDQLAAIGNNTTAYKAAVTYTVPVFPVLVSGEWEHVGRAFENAALPFPKAATERYTLATQATLFKSFVTAGIQFNHLRLESFSSTGKNIKWGFDIRTHSKRYPEIYVSYKPFSTFRSYDDTLAIAQRPMVGSVSIGRVSYQIKDAGIHHRLMLTYNSNSSIQEDIQYKSTTVQFTYMLTNLNDMVSVTVGWMKQPQFLPGASSNLSSYLANASYSRNLNKELTVTTGGDVAVASYGLQRAGVSSGLTYSLANKPLTFRFMGRYSGFRASEVMTQENLWNCMLACNWQIRPMQKKRQIQ